MLELSFARAQDNLFSFLGTLNFVLVKRDIIMPPQLCRAQLCCAHGCGNGAGVGLCVCKYLRVSIVIPRSHPQPQKPPWRSITFLPRVFSTP